MLQKFYRLELAAPPTTKAGWTGLDNDVIWIEFNNPENVVRALRMWRDRIDECIEDLAIETATSGASTR